MRQTISKLALLALLAFHPLHAQAQETSADFSAGAVKIGYDSTTCSSSIEGAIRYDSSSGNIALCNGTNWTAPGGGCTAPASCSSLGSTCSDGSLFAGFMIYSSSCAALYVTDADQGTSIAYSSELIDTGADSYSDGKANQNWIVTNETLSQYPAIQTCENLSRHSKTDWYLPAAAELKQVYLSGISFTVDNYWSSSEVQFDTDNAYYLYAPSGDIALDGFKQYNAADVAVRCVRRD